MAHVPQRSGDSFEDNIQIQRVAGMCKPSSSTSIGFTIQAVRCDTSEETRMQQQSALHRNPIEPYSPESWLRSLSVKQSGGQIVGRLVKGSALCVVALAQMDRATAF